MAKIEVELNASYGCDCMGCGYGSEETIEIEVNEQELETFRELDTEIFYHGSCYLFDKFSSAFLGAGEGKSKFGHGIYITSSFATAALYAAKAGKRHGVDTFYVYTVEVPVLTDGNHLFSCKPVTAAVASRIEKALGESIPEEVKSLGKYFRKYVGNILTNKRGTVKQMRDKADDAAEDAVTSFLNDNGVIYLAYPYAQTKPDGDTNRAVLNENDIRIVKVEQVKVDDNNKLVEESAVEIKSF